MTFSFDPRTGQKIDFTPDMWWVGLDNDVGAKRKAHKVLNNVIQEISAKKREQM